MRARGTSRFGPTLASEHLAADLGLEVPRETLRRWMLAAGLWSRRRKRQPHRTRRVRKAHFGELIHLDGSHHHWLEERGPKACLMNFVDDATGVALCRFSDQETTWCRGRSARSLGTSTGVQQGVVRCDLKNVYQRQPTSTEALAGIKPETQFGRIVPSSALRMAASSPQAKGRVERHHGTRQDRLIKKIAGGIVEYRRTVISTRSTWPSTTSASPVSRRRQRTFTRRSPTELRGVFCCEYERVVSNDRVVRFENRFAVEAETQPGRGGARVTANSGAMRACRSGLTGTRSSRRDRSRDATAASCAPQQLRGAGDSGGGPPLRRAVLRKKRAANT